MTVKTVRVNLCTLLIVKYSRRLLFKILKQVQHDGFSVQHDGFSVQHNGFSVRHDGLAFSMMIYKLLEVGSF